MEEIFKPIIGYEDSYEISNLGRVRSVSRVVLRKQGGAIPIKERIIIPCKNRKGYLKIRLARGGKEKRPLVHRLVSNAFIPNDENKPFVNHIDGNKQNNHISNLEWCTAK